MSDFATINDIYRQAVLAGVPRHTAIALANYLGAGHPCSSFLSTFLCGNVFASALNADPSNEAAFVLLCRFFSNWVPTTAFGSVQKYHRWCDRGGMRLPAEVPPVIAPTPPASTLQRRGASPLGYSWAAIDADSEAA